MNRDDGDYTPSGGYLQGMVDRGFWNVIKGYERDEYMQPAAGSHQRSNIHDDEFPPGEKPPGGYLQEMVDRGGFRNVINERNENVQLAAGKRQRFNQQDNEVSSFRPAGGYLRGIAERGFWNVVYEFQQNETTQKSKNQSTFDLRRRVHQNGYSKQNVQPPIGTLSKTDDDKKMKKQEMQEQCGSESSVDLQAASNSSRQIAGPWVSDWDPPTFQFLQ